MSGRLVMCRGRTWMLQRRTKAGGPGPNPRMWALPYRRHPSSPMKTFSLDASSHSQSSLSSKSADVTTQYSVLGTTDTLTAFPPSTASPASSPRQVRASVTDIFAGDGAILEMVSNGICRMSIRRIRHFPMLSSTRDLAAPSNSGPGSAWRRG